jgi:hypothetical protein
MDLVRPGVTGAAIPRPGLRVAGGVDRYVRSVEEPTLKGANEPVDDQQKHK